MSKTVKPIPDGFRTMTPYLTLRDSAPAIDFYKKAFGAQEVMRMPGPEGKGVKDMHVRRLPHPGLGGAGDRQGA
jgi:uncharacterized glyoxalase superfamily protein PhnB